MTDYLDSIETARNADIAAKWAACRAVAATTLNDKVEDDGFITVYVSPPLKQD